MRRYCGEAQYMCAVTAGSGVTVTGNGSTSTPYTVSATLLVLRTQRQPGVLEGAA